MLLRGEILYVWGGLSDLISAKISTSNGVVFFVRGGGYEKHR